MVARQWQRSSRGGSGGRVAAAASLAVEAAAWQKCNFGGSNSALGSVVAAWRQRQQRSVGGGSMAYADNDYNGNNDNHD